MKTLTIQEVNECVRICDDGFPVCEMLGTHRQKILAAREIVSAVAYRRTGKARRDDQRLAAEQVKRWGAQPPRHLDLGGGVHALAFGTPAEGGMSFHTADAGDRSSDYRGLAKLTREEALAFVPYLNMPKLLRDTFRKLINGEHLKVEEVAK